MNRIRNRAIGGAIFFAFVVVLLVRAAISGREAVNDGDRRPVAPEAAVLAPSQQTVASSPVAIPPADAETLVLPGATDAPATDRSDYECLEAVEEAAPDLFVVVDPWRSAEMLDAAVGPLAAAQPKLLASSDPEHRLAAVMFDPLVPVSAEVVLAELTPDSGNVLVAWHGLRLCLEQTSGSCPLEQRFLDELVNLAGSNSEVWAQVAVSRYRRGEFDAALEALERAASSSESTAYWVDSVAMMERALRASAELETGTRLSLAFGAFESPDYGTVELMCRERSVLGNDWAEACLALGELMEAQHRMRLGQSMGRALRLAVERALTDAGEPADALLEAPRREAAPTAAYISPRLVEAMARSSATQFYRYLDQVRSRGELTGTIEYVRQELEGFLAPLGLAECAGPLLR